MILDFPSESTYPVSRQVYWLGFILLPVPSQRFVTPSVVQYGFHLPYSSGGCSGLVPLSLFIPAGNLLPTTISFLL